MLWSTETDDFMGTCGEKYPLLKTLNAELRGGVPVPPTVDPVPTEQPLQTTQSPIQPPSPPPPPPSGVCKQEGYARDAKDCSIFYYCQNVGDKFEAHQFKCANGLVFDLATNNCNYKKYVVGCD